MYSGVEQIIHGDTKGYIYNHDIGNSFSYQGTLEDIKAEYETPYLDFGDMGTRKTLQYIKTSVTPDAGAGGFSQPTLRVKFDFEDANIQQPAPYTFPEIRGGAFFGDAVFGEAYFGSAESPLIRQPIQGSCYTSNFSINSDDQLQPYTINGLYINYVPAGRR